jgi:hypothetical protein
MNIQKKEEGEESLNNDKESKGQNINVNNAKTKSNGYRRIGEHKTLI